MKTEFAACEHCGQYYTVSVPNDATDEEIRLATIEACGCSEAEKQKKIKRNILNAECMLNKLFGDEAPKYGLPTYQEAHLLDYLYKTIEMAANERLLSATINIGDYGKVKIAVTASGKVEVERIRTVKQRF